MSHVQVLRDEVLMWLANKHGTQAELAKLE